MILAPALARTALLAILALSLLSAIAPSKPAALTGIDLSSLQMRSAMKAVMSKGLSDADVCFNGGTM